MKDHETTSENLKKRAFSSRRAPPELPTDRTALLSSAVRFSIRDLDKDYHQSEEDIKALQSVGQIIGEVLKKLDDERCASPCLPSSSLPRLLVVCDCSDTGRGLSLGRADPCLLAAANRRCSHR